MTTPLRDYQIEARYARDEAHHRGIRRSAIVMATGLGKTVIFSHEIADLSRDNRRSMVVVHRDELVNQTVNKLHENAPHLKVGVIKAERNEIGGDIDVFVVSVLTLSRTKRLAQLDPWRVHHLVIDECHHSAANSYMRLMNYFGCFSNGATATGYTATLTREDKKGLGDIWEEVTFERDVLFGIDKGWLRDVRGKAVTIDDMDLATVARSRGDYMDGSLGEALESSGAGPVVAEAFLEHAVHEYGPNRYRQGLGFAPTVRAAEYFNSEFNAAGIASRLVIGETPKSERGEIYAGINAGTVQTVWSCGVLVEGFDKPALSCGIMARPTMSAGLYVQMAGRVLRPDLRPLSVMPVIDDVQTRPIPDALLLDAVGVGARHKLAGMASLTKTEIEPEDGETLAEAAFRAMAEAEQNEAKRRQMHAERASRMAGNVAYEDIDLFRLSHSAWLQTKGGVWFIPTRDRTWFLWPDGINEETGDETWKVGVYQGYSTKGGKWTHERLGLEYAMAFAEAEAGDWDPSVSLRTAPWRRSKAKPTDAQLGLCARYGIDTNLKSKAEVSDLISIHVASRTLDRRKART